MKLALEANLRALAGGWDPGSIVGAAGVVGELGGLGMPSGPGGRGQWGGPAWEAGQLGRGGGEADLAGGWPSLRQTVAAAVDALK